MSPPEGSVAPVAGVSPGIKWRVVAIYVLAILVIASVVIAALISFLRSVGVQASHSASSPSSAPASTPPATTPSASPSNPNIDRFAEYRTKPSYAGKLSDRHIVPGPTYYLPSSVRLLHMGKGQWFVGEIDAPLMRVAADAGPYPYRVTIDIEPAFGQFDGGNGIEITLPGRTDFARISTNIGPMWAKGIYPPVDDIRDPEFDHLPMIALTSVFPAEGHELSDYYVDDPRPSQLRPGQSAALFPSDVKVIAGTKRGYVDDRQIQGWAAKSGKYIRITNTGHGFSVCVDEAGGLQSYIDIVDPRFVPLQSQIPFRLQC